MSVTWWKICSVKRKWAGFDSDYLHMNSSCCFPSSLFVWKCQWDLQKPPESSSVLHQSRFFFSWDAALTCADAAVPSTGKKVWNKLDCADRLRCSWRSVMSFLVTSFFLYIQIHLMWRATFQVSVLELYVVKLVRTVQLLNFPSLKDLVAVWCSSGLFVSMCLFHKLWPNIWYNFIYNRGVLWNVII